MSHADVTHRQNTTAITNRFKRSPNIWGTCPLSWIKKNYPEGYLRWSPEQHLLAGTQTTEIAGPQPGSKVFSTTALVVDTVSSVGGETWGGAIRFGGDTDNDSSSLAQAYPSFRMSGLGGSTDNALWFEACVAVSSILTNTLGFFVGLAETDQWTLATGVPFNGGDAITNAASAIGWRKEEDGLGVLDVVYSDRATSFTNIIDDITTSANGSFSAMAVDTFMKIGFVYNPSPGNKGREYDANKVIRFFQNNKELGTYVSKSTLTGLTNLDANALGPIVSQITDSSGTAAKFYLKWLEVAQLPPGINP